MQQITESLSGKEQPESLSSIQQQIEAKIAAEGLQDLIQTELDRRRPAPLAELGPRVRLRQRRDPRGADRRCSTACSARFVPYMEQYGFAVEGHTDSQPITAGSPYKSNWELSADRANAVRTRMETVGVARGRRIRVEGYADTVALPEEELQGPVDEAERLARHRRVVVRIY
jgi:chemotaxis protein MotB